MHVLDILGNETAKLEEILITQSWLLFLTFRALQFAGKATSKILINNRPAVIQSRFNAVDQIKQSN